MGPAEYLCPATGRPRSVLAVGLDLQRKTHRCPAGLLLRRLPWSTLLRGKAVRGPAEGRGHLRRDGAPGEGVTRCGTVAPRAVSVPQSPRRVSPGEGGGAVASRRVPSRPARRPPAALGCSLERFPSVTPPRTGCIPYKDICVSGFPSPAVPIRAGGKTLWPLPPALPWGLHRPCGRPPPHAVPLSRGGRWQTARGAAPGRRGAGAGWEGPPVGADGASPVTSAGGYKREARRGTPAAQAAPAVERRDARRGPGTGTHAADPSSLHPQGRFATVASPLTSGLRSPSRHDVPRLRWRVRGAVLPLQQRFPGRGQPHLLPFPGGLILEHGLACQPAGESPSVPAALLPGAGAFSRGRGGSGWRGAGGVRGGGQVGNWRGERPRCRGGAVGGCRGPGRVLRRVCKAASLIKREFIEETPEQRLRQRGRQRYL